MDAKGLVATYRGTAKLMYLRGGLPPVTIFHNWDNQVTNHKTIIYRPPCASCQGGKNFVFSLNLEMWKTGSRDWSSENYSPFWLRRDPGAHGSNPFISQMREERAREERFTHSGSAKWHLEPQLSDSQAAMFSTLQRNRAHWLAHISCQYFVVE